MYTSFKNECKHCIFYLLGGVRMVYNDKEFIAKKIKQARIKSGLTQEELAERIEISTQQVSRIEVGMYIPSLPTFLNIANILNLNLRDFGVDVKENDNNKTNELIKILQTFNETEIECCYNTIKALIQNFKLLKNSKK